MRLHAHYVHAFAFASLHQIALGDAQQDALGNAQIPLLAQNHTLPKRVAIIGAGAAGSSTAYFLRKYADEANLPIDIIVFEKNSYIGGRSTTVFAFENEDEAALLQPRIPVELGASIFVNVNRILVDAVNEFNLSTDSASRPRSGEEDERELLGVWNGDQFVFTQRLGGSKWQSWWSTAKLLWRYGVSPYRTLKLMQSTVGGFFRLYDEPLFPWRNGLSEAIAETGLLNVT
jgi:prenylcysteine oxidase/farnesylcysteine lyase